MDIRKYSNLLIFFIAIGIIFFGLKLYKTDLGSLRFLLVMALLASPLTLILKFPEKSSNTYVILLAFMVGSAMSVFSALVPYRVYSNLMATSFLISAYVATSFLLRVAKPSRSETAAFFIWVLVSIALSLLFNLPTGHKLDYPRLKVGNPILLNLVKYLEATLVPIVFCLLYQKIKTFLIFLSMPVIMGFIFLIL